ncbi:hypothetical protein [Sulfuricurvum sp.]|uniref:hypothetical protein n=1 Tax=Sulfuricurvum sp. TaxID=2025608 RepID=UPI002627B876|nr:hypothetical protein [Sulfuricurvum sp.]MDD4950572.1 hypothetical protein [Sulfuricurvum sp.]
MDSEKAERSKRFSHIGMHSNSDMTYAMQYKEAFDALYDSSKPVDTIALPMMFLMRHYLELILKSNIVYFAKFSESDCMLKKINLEHKLLLLANAFKEHWKLVAKKHGLNFNDKVYIKNFDLLIDLVDQIDKYSMSFRYSHDKEDKKHFEWGDTLDIFNIKKCLMKSYRFSIILPMCFMIK